MQHWRRILVGCVAGTMLLGGATAASFAATPSGTPGTPGANGWQDRIATILAQDSGQSVAQVQALKQQDKTWKAVVQALGVNQTTLRQQMQAAFPGRHHGSPIVAVLAKASGKTPAEIQALKQGKTWSQVAQSLGLNLQTLMPNFGKRFPDGGPMVQFLAQKSGKTVAQIQALLKQDKNPMAVAQSLGITKQEMMQAMPHGKRFPGRGGMVQFLAQKSGKTVAQIQALLKQDKNPMTVAKSLGITLPPRPHGFPGGGVIVQVLSQASGKTPAEIQAMKTQGVTWSQVASQLGLNWSTIQSQVRAAMQAKFGNGTTPPSGTTQQS